MTQIGAAVALTVMATPRRKRPTQNMASVREIVNHYDHMQGTWRRVDIIRWTAEAWMATPRAVNMADSAMPHFLPLASENWPANSPPMMDPALMIATLRPIMSELREKSVDRHIYVRKADGDTICRTEEPTLCILVKRIDRTHHGLIETHCLVHVASATTWFRRIPSVGDGRFIRIH